MTNVTSEIIAGIDKAGNRGKGGRRASHEVASHQGRIKEGLDGRPVGKGVRTRRYRGGRTTSIKSSADRLGEPRARGTKLSSRE